LRASRDGRSRTTPWNVGACGWDSQSESVIAVRSSEVRQVWYGNEQEGSEVVERPHANGEGDTRHRPQLQVERDRRSDALFRTRARARKSSTRCGLERHLTMETTKQ